MLAVPTVGAEADADADTDAAVACSSTARV